MQNEEYEKNIIKKNERKFKKHFEGKTERVKEVKRVKYYDHILVKTLKSNKGTLMRFNEDVE